MSDASPSEGPLASWNENGQLFLVVGILTTLVAWFFLPLAGLVSVYCGLGLWTTHGRKIAGGIIVGFGGLGVSLWIAVLVSLAL